MALEKEWEDRKAACDKEREERRQVEARLDALWANTDKRIADLVSAIGKLIEGRPQ